MSKEYPIALYKYPGPFDLHGHQLAYATADSEEALNVALDDGWKLTTDEAVEAGKPKPVEVKKDVQKDSTTDGLSKEELLAKAKELGIPAKGTWGEEKLKEEIAKVSK